MVVLDIFSQTVQTPTNKITPSLLIRVIMNPIKRKLSNKNPIAFHFVVDEESPNDGEFSFVEIHLNSFIAHFFEHVI